MTLCPAQSLDQLVLNDMVEGHGESQMPQETDVPQFSLDKILMKSVSNTADSQLRTGAFGIDLTLLSLFGSGTVKLLILVVGLPEELG